MSACARVKNDEGSTAAGTPRADILNASCCVILKLKFDSTLLRGTCCVVRQWCNIVTSAVYLNTNSPVQYGVAEAYLRGTSLRGRVRVNTCNAKTWTVRIWSLKLLSPLTFRRCKSAILYSEYKV